MWFLVARGQDKCFLKNFLPVMMMRLCALFALLQPYTLDAQP
jgi:hypothetical protein